MNSSYGSVILSPTKMIYPFLAVCIELQFVVVTDCNDPWVCT